MANTMAMAIAQMLSSIVAGSRTRKMWNASCPGSTAVETPNSPLDARCRNFRYCT